MYADGKCQCRKSGEADGKRVEIEVEDGHVASPTFMQEVCHLSQTCGKHS